MVKRCTPNCFCNKPSPSLVDEVLFGSYSQVSLQTLYQMLSPVHTHTHTHTPRHVHTHTHTHTTTCTHTHTHTHDHEVAVGRANNGVVIGGAYSVITCLLSAASCCMCSISSLYLEECYIQNVHVTEMKKEGRKKQARSNKQQGKATQQHTQGSHMYIVHVHACNYTWHMYMYF